MFIVIDGLDGSGKSTQVSLTEQNLINAEFELKRIKLPDYDSPSCSLVNMYLSGEFGKKAEDVNVYAATAFYAVDRFANFSLKWKDDYISGKNILAERYTTSNAIYQAAKLPDDQWDSYLDWLADFEYNKIGIPKPDITIFLDMPIEVSQKIMSRRYNGDEGKKDVHERDTEFLNKCRKAALYAADKWDWKVIKCNSGDEPRSIEEINDEIMIIINAQGV